MMKTYALPILFLILGLGAAALAQKKDRVEVNLKISAPTAGENCPIPKAGRAVSLPKPDYPATARTARVGGTVLLTATIDNKGSVSDAAAVSGHRLLQEAALNAARRAKFVPATCGRATGTKSAAVLRYDFVPFVAAGRYFAPAKIEEFADLEIDSPYYETISTLNGNYRLAFGYADKKFYAHAPLTRADFAHSLRLTLDLLTARAAAANKIPREINLFNALNPQNLTAAVLLRDLRASQPFYDSLKTLVSKYDIVLTNEKNEFQDYAPVTNNELIDLWSKIFGAEAIPINFAVIENDRLISRGEFALFLQESLQVLTYKVLP